MNAPYCRSGLGRLLPKDPEDAHDMALKVLEWTATRLGRFNPFRQDVVNRSVTVMGIEFPNRIGLAAGMDKNATCLNGMAALGFGHIEVGSITMAPQPGNDRPRVWERHNDRAIINHMGMPNDGFANVFPRLLERDIGQTRVGVSLAVSSKLTTPPPRQISLPYMSLARTADYMVVNASCPNVVLDVDWHHVLRSIVLARMSCHDFGGQWRPLVVKISPASPIEELKALLSEAMEIGIDGVIVSNLTHQSDTIGGLSGIRTFSSRLELVRQVKDIVGDDMAIIMSGGVFSDWDVGPALEAGADLIQIYTSLVYRGPAVVKELVDRASWYDRNRENLQYIKEVTSHGQ